MRSRGERHVDADGADAGIIAKTEARRVADALFEIGQAALEGCAGVEERHDSDCVGDLDPRLHRSFEQATPAHRQVERPAWAQGPIGEATHRAATAGEEADIGRDVLQARARDGAESDAAGEDVAGLVVEGVISRALRLGDEDRRIRAQEPGIGCHRGGGTEPLRRIEQIVGGIVGDGEWHADEAVIDLSERVLRASGLTVDADLRVERVGEPVPDADRAAGRVRDVGLLRLAAREDIGHEIVARAP